jgi:hypothetical protein
LVIAHEGAPVESCADQGNLAIAWVEAATGLSMVGDTEADLGLE